MSASLAASPAIQARMRRFALALGNGAAPETVDHLLDDLVDALAVELDTSTHEIRGALLAWMQQPRPVEG